MEAWPIRIKRLRTSRSLRLRVLENGEIVLTAPLRLPDYFIEEFLDEHRDWINEKATKAKEKQHALTQQREVLLFRGREYLFRLAVEPTKKPNVVMDNGKILVTAKSEDHQEVRSVLEKWYRKQAETYFKKRLPLLADLVGKDVGTVSIRSQKTRWGSCSSRTTISLNWRLIMTPDSVSDYVIYHELAHLTHMNHSKRFWDLVADYIPSYKEAEKWLKTHHELLRF